ncbi:hypothetical protein BP00DRAFT_96358 [Aspergillus indologenus CBS 114.80]|uniref:Uncharacterized protein n=1 Tax=Aspergillus indologenus CBS 114.80 TaxID=1450541 RepID=A0A2V5IB07_9EURO|nr:hypothetical protein BP00DRAFT_96358 [Aspergillus indologenus CBS 114.80]
MSPRYSHQSITSESHFLGMKKTKGLRMLLASYTNCAQWDPGLSRIATMRETVKSLQIFITSLYKMTISCAEETELRWLKLRLPDVLQRFRKLGEVSANLNGADGLNEALLSVIGDLAMYSKDDFKSANDQIKLPNVICLAVDRYDHALSIIRG